MHRFAQVVAAEFTGGFERAGAQARLRIGERCLQARARVDPVQGTGGKPEAAAERIVRVEQFLYRAVQMRPLDPAQRREQPRRRFRHPCGKVDHKIDACPGAALQRQHGGCEQLARLLELELLAGELPPRLARDPQAIDMRLDAVVELGQVLQSIVGCPHRGGSQQPQKGGFLSVLAYNIVAQYRSHRSRPPED